MEERDPMFPFNYVLNPLLHVFILVLTIGYAGVTTGCKKKEERPEPTLEQKVSHQRANTQGLVRTMMFVKHPLADNLCFGAWFSSEYRRSSAAFTVVPCEKVEHLLVNPDSGAKR